MNGLFSVKPNIHAIRVLYRTVEQLLKANNWKVKKGTSINIYSSSDGKHLNMIWYNVKLKGFEWLGMFKKCTIQRFMLFTVTKFFTYSKSQIWWESFSLKLRCQLVNRELSIIEAQSFFWRSPLLFFKYMTDAYGVSKVKPFRELCIEILKCVKESSSKYIFIRNSACTYRLACVSIGLVLMNAKVIDWKMWFEI